MIAHVFFRPPVHGRIVNWLGPDMVRQLLDFAQTQRDCNRIRASRVWNAGAKATDLTVRRSYSVEFSGTLRDEIKEAASAALPEMCRQLGSGQFKPSKFEVEMVAHGDGAFFAEHCDRSMSPLLGRRIISAVYYFHRLPKLFSGGVLRIYPLAGREKSENFAEIDPMNDTLVFFPSWFPHEVLRVNCPSGQFEASRFAINCWIHS